MVSERHVACETKITTKNARFSQCCLLNIWNIYTICACQGRCVALFLTDDVISYRYTGATFVRCRLLLRSGMFDRLHYKSLIKRSEASFLKYLGSVWQHFRSEMMFWDRYTCLFTRQVANVISTVTSWEGNGRRWWRMTSNFVHLHRCRCDREYEHFNL